MLRQQHHCLYLLLITAKWITKNPLEHRRALVVHARIVASALGLSDATSASFGVVAMAEEAHSFVCESHACNAQLIFVLAL